MKVLKTIWHGIFAIGATCESVLFVLSSFDVISAPHIHQWVIAVLWGNLAFVFLADAINALCEESA